VHVTDEVKKGTLAKKVERKLYFWCFSAGVAMHDILQQKITNLILTSGTLSPLDSFAQELQTYSISPLLIHSIFSPFPIRLENKHVIKPHQVMIGVLTKGPSGKVRYTIYIY
jgi:regulator of telomere elongation helicase 1